METVSQFAKRGKVSRSTVLYYESIGLIEPAHRTAAGYRLYGEREQRALEQIKLYRSVGVSVEEIRTILSAHGNQLGTVLKRRLAELENEIAALHDHQRVILKLLRINLDRRKRKNMTKDKWVTIMKESGFTEQDMHRWHRQFEKSAPADHEEFLKFLNIPAGEIGQIREWSRKEG